MNTPPQYPAPEHDSLLPIPLVDDAPPRVETPPRETPGPLDIVLLIPILIAAALLAIGTTGFALGVWMHVHHLSMDKIGKSQQLEFVVVMQAMLYLFAAAICVPVFSWFWKKSFGGGIHWNGLAASSRAVGFIGFGIVLSIAVTVVSKLIKIPDSAPILDLFKSPTLAWIATIFGALIAPAAEEIAFRGFLLPVFQRYTGRIVAVALTSAIFALLHANQIGHAWGAVGILFLVSVILCEVRLRFNSVAASTLVHMSYNSALFVAMIYATGGYRHFDKIFPS